MTSKTPRKGDPRGLTAGIAPRPRDAGGPEERDRIIQEMTEIFLARRTSDVPSFLDAVFAKAELCTNGSATAIDPLLADLLMFEEGRLPKHTNLFNADCGNLLEKLFKKLLEITRPDIADVSDATMCKLGDEAEALSRGWQRKFGKKAPKWKKADMVLDSTVIVECKYRFNSYGTKHQQIGISKVYQEMGFTPIFLHLSPAFNHTADFESAGWIVHSCAEMIAFVDALTGYDLRDLFRAIAAQPIVRRRLEGAHADLIERQKRELWSDYYYAPDEVRADFQARTAADRGSLEGLADRIANDPDPVLDAGMLRDRAETLCDDATATLPAEKVDALVALIGSLDDDQRAEVLSAALRKSSPATQAEVMADIG